MRENGYRARPKRRAKPKDEGERAVIADNILDRDFAATLPNQKWLADFTYSAPRPGWSGVHMTGMLKGKEEDRDSHALCCEGT